MISTFFGLEISRRGLFTQQQALHVTGQNVANANTPGYSRQRVNFEATEPFPPVGLNSPRIPGQMGTGVEAGTIQRIRDAFLDVQYRTENNKLGYWQARTESYKKLEEIMNEPSDTGLSHVMDEFWQALQDFAKDPTNDGARTVAVQRGIAVTETFHYLASSLTTIQDDINNEIDVVKQEINSLAKQIADLNKQIGDVEPNGYLPNDLYDERDRLIDQLSSLVDVKIEYKKSGGNALDIAEGQVIITLNNEDNDVLVSKDEFYELEASTNSSDATGTITVDINSTPFGKLKALMEASEKIYPDMLKELDNLASTFAKRFNEIQTSGWNPTGDPSPVFFENYDSALTITVNQELIDNPNKLANADTSTPTVGDSTNAWKLANVINEELEYSSGETASFKKYYQGVIGEMAVNSQQAQRLSGNSEVLRQAVEERRMAVSSVSLDEEMTNMIQFQHAYSASARMITVQDQILDKIINGMGVVGR